MTEPRSLVKPGASPLLAWTLAWAVMGICLHLSGVLNKPRTGPLWVALLGGLLPWALAGAVTFPKPARLTLALLWALAFLLSFGLSASLMASLVDAIPMLILAFALGPAVGAFASALLADPSLPGGSLLVGFLWFLGFLPGTWIGFIGIYAAPELTKLLLGPLTGIPAALTIGYGLGAALGGLAGSGFSLGLIRLVRR